MQDARDVRAVGFLDLAGYTSLTDVHGDEDGLAELSARVCTRLDAEPAFPVLR